MKTQTMTNKIGKLLFTALASLVLMNAACQKNNDSSVAAQPIGVYPNGCPTYPCTPGVGQVALYGGTTTNGNYFQVNFQVTGDQSGYGSGFITGVVNANNFLCNMGPQYIAGQFQMQGQGTMSADVFNGMVTLSGPTGTFSTQVQVVPSRTQGAGLFSLALPCVTNRVDMNF